MTDVASPLLGRRERLWPVVLVSLALHSGAIAFALLHRTPAIVDLSQKPIAARLVRLGPKKPESYLPRRLDEPPPPAAAPVAIPVAGAPTSKSPPPRAGPKPTTPARRDALADAMRRVQRDAALHDPVYGSPEGDVQGDSEDASEGDRYLALVWSAIHSNYHVPTTLSERDRASLKAVVVLFHEPDGRVSNWRVQQKSGNGTLDAAIERAVRQTPRLPPPPPEVRGAYQSEGLGVRFSGL